MALLVVVLKGYTVRSSLHAESHQNKRRTVKRQSKAVHTKRPLSDLLGVLQHEKQGFCSGDLTADVVLSLRLQDWQWEVEGVRTGFYWGWREGGNTVGTPPELPHHLPY